MVVVWLASCASNAPRAVPAPKPLTPSDVGLPDEPIAEATSPPEYVPRRVTSGYFRKEECPPDHRGCWVEQEVTHERVTVHWRCRRETTSFVSARSLRTLTNDLQIGEGGIDRSVARRALLRELDPIRRCFDSDGVAQRVELQFTIHEGRLIGLEVASKCLRDAFEHVDLPHEPTFTPVRWTFDYTLEDPASVPPLQC